MSTQKLKRFVLMGGSKYYASGGFKDYISSHDSKEEATKAMEEWLNSKEDMREYSWAHVGDTETGDLWGEGEACNPLGFKL